MTEQSVLCHDNVGETLSDVRVPYAPYPSLDLTASITFLRNHDLDPTSGTGDGTRERVLKEVAGVTIVALVDEDPV